jgi:hypothetical protein
MRLREVGESVQVWVVLLHSSVHLVVAAIWRYRHPVRIQFAIRAHKMLVVHVSRLAKGTKQEESSSLVLTRLLLYS